MPYTTNTRKVQDACGALASFPGAAPLTSKSLAGVFIRCCVCECESSMPSLVHQVGHFSYALV